MGMDMRFWRKDGTQGLYGDLTIRYAALYYDQIIEIKPIYMAAGDSFQITLNLRVLAYVNGPQTDYKSVQVKDTLTVTKATTVRFCRITHRQDLNKSKVRIYEGSPELPSIED
jgi:hypothetical protein